MVRTASVRSLSNRGGWGLQTEARASPLGLQIIVRASGWLNMQISMFFILLLIVGDLKWVQIQDYDGQRDVQIASGPIVGSPLRKQSGLCCACNDN